MHGWFSSPLESARALPGRALTGRWRRKLNSEHELYQQETDADGAEGRHQARYHEAVVQYVLSYAGRAGAVKVDGCYYGRVVGDEEVAVDCREHGNQEGGRDAEADAERHEGPHRGGLAVKEDRESEEGKGEQPGGLSDHVLDGAAQELH